MICDAEVLRGLEQGVRLRDDGLPIWRFRGRYHGADLPFRPPGGSSFELGKGWGVLEIGAGGRVALHGRKELLHS